MEAVAETKGSHGASSILSIQEVEREYQTGVQLIQLSRTISAARAGAVILPMFTREAEPETKVLAELRLGILLATRMIVAEVTTHTSPIGI